MKSLRHLFLIAVFWGVPALASQSTLVTPGAPLTMPGLASFLNSALPSLGSCNSGPSAPANGPGAAAFAGECWINTTANPWVLSYYDGTSWVTFGTLNTTTHVFTTFTGTSGASVPLLSTANTWGATQTFPANSLTLAQFPTVGANTALGSIAGGTPAALTATQLTTLCNVATQTLSGCVPNFPNNTSSFLRGDGSYQTLSFAALAISGSTIQANQFQTGPGLITNAMHANMAAWTLKGNATSGAAAPADFTIDGLTNKASPAAGDEVIIWDVAGAAIKKASVSSVGSAGSVSSIAGNTGAFTLGIGLTNAANDIRASLSSVSNSLGADVLLNNTANYFDGPSIAQGTSGTWFVSGTVTVSDTSQAGGMFAKLWDGTTVIASALHTTSAAGADVTIALSGVITSPAGNLRISVKDNSTTNGVIRFNITGNSKDSTITAIRIQ